MTYENALDRIARTNTCCNIKGLLIIKVIKKKLLVEVVIQASENTATFGQFHRNEITFWRIFWVFKFNVWEKRGLSVVSVKVVICNG